MKRKFLCALLSAFFALGSMSALAADDITVSVDRRTVYFADQQPVIINDRTLVPARGVFEALGARVLWDAEARKVTIFSKDNLSRLILYIDSTEFKQLTFKSLLSYDVKDFTSEVAPQIINDRTMIPLYLVADYMGNKADWNGEERSITVTSKERLKLLAETDEATLNGSLPSISLSADKADVTAGEEITIRVNLSNTDKTLGKFFGVTASVNYDRNNFEFKSITYPMDTENSAKADNPDYMSNKVKFLYLHDPTILAPLCDTTLAELVFVAKTDNGGDFALSDLLINGSYDTTLTIETENGDKVLEAANELYIDTTSVTVK